MFLDDDDDEVCLFGFSSDVVVAVIVVVVVSIGSLLLLNFPPDCLEALVLEEDEASGSRLREEPRAPLEVGAV